MKKTMVLVFGLMLLSGLTMAHAEVLSDGAMSGVYAGQFDGTVNQVSAMGSALADQSNVGVIDSSEGCVFDTSMDNTNSAEVTNNGGDSAIAMQSNIAAISGLSVDPACANTNNTITNSNDATVSNVVDPTIEGSVDGQSVQGSTSIGELTVNVVSSLESAIASQSNVGAIAGIVDVSASSISNINTASVVQ